MAHFQRDLGRVSLEYKLPVICQFRYVAEARWLVTYGVRCTKILGMLAAKTAKVPKGAKPADVRL